MNTIGMSETELQAIVKYMADLERVAHLPLREFAFHVENFVADSLSEGCPYAMVEEIIGDLVNMRFGVAPRPGSATEEWSV